MLQRLVVDALTKENNNNLAMMHKHGGKRGGSKNTAGVADYFAVLGIDSFLPPDADDDEEGHNENEEIPSVVDNGDRNGVGDDDVCSDVASHAASAAATDDFVRSPPSSPVSSPSEVPSNADGQGSDDDDDDAVNERQGSMQTVHAGNLSSEARTPRNSNRSKQSTPSSTTTTTSAHPSKLEPSALNGLSIPEGSTMSDTTSPIDNDGGKPRRKSEEQLMREERFQREIVQLSLISKPSPLVDSDDGWTCLEEGILPLRGGKLQTKNSARFDAGVHLAYRRRGKRVATDDDDDDENDCNDDREGDAKLPQHHYYDPGVADVAIHHVKVRPSTIPNFAKKYITNPSRSDGPNNITGRQSTQNDETTSATTSATSSNPVKAPKSLVFGAKHLSFLARRAGMATGIVGKEMAAGLANVVKSRSPVEAVAERTVVDEDDANGDGRSDRRPRNPRETGGEGSFDTDVASSEFEDAHGDVRLWQSNSEVESGSDVFSGGNSSVVSANDNEEEEDDVNNNGSTTSERASSTTSRRRREHFFPDTPMPPRRSHGREGGEVAGGEGGDPDVGDGDGIARKALREMLPLPDGYDEWVIPDFAEVLHVPTPDRVGRRRQPVLLDRTHALPSPACRDAPGIVAPPSPACMGGGMGSPSSIGMEAMYLSPAPTPMQKGGVGKTLGSTMAGGGGESQVLLSRTRAAPDPSFLPVLVSPTEAIPTDEGEGDDANAANGLDEDAHVYIPILAIRRQRTGEEERFHEDPSVVDVKLAYYNSDGTQPSIAQEDDDDEEEFDRNFKTFMQNGSHPDILKKSPWAISSAIESDNEPAQHRLRRGGHGLVLVRRNLPNGFADLPFPAKVLDRFPQKNYRGMPFPEEELPLFCYAGGSLLVRDKLRNLSVPRSFGFVVKNERGDSIYVSCLTFMEPLTKQRKQELNQLSMRRRDTSLPHRIHCRKTLERRSIDIFGAYLVGFDDVVTFENKTICLVGRYPYWTETRRFLTHLHLLSGSSSDIPLERNISHLLLSVPVPKPGGQCVLVPFSTMNEPMALVMPPLKDLPLVDLSYRRVFAALDVPTVVTIVLGFLCLEKKVILISTRQALLLDCCELLKSLLFPFDLCAPYVPHLTQPFMSCLEFPGATFVGIHDNGQAKNGLANIVRTNIPEDSIIVELDSGEINCDGNRYETLRAAYQIIPAESRSILIKEVETLCQDAGIVPGQEPLDSGIDSAIESTVPSNMSEHFGKRNQQHYEPLDDRAVRDNFLRFFCSILGGYERFLVVPDADFLTSGDDWFDSSKFLAAAASNRAPFLTALVDTQLFQSFIQRRTEASDVHCVLFDECLAEYHSSNVPYGRLTGDSGSQVDGDGGSQQQSDLSYNLLVDQVATEPDLLPYDDESSFLARSEVGNKSFGHDYDTVTQASSGYAESSLSDTPSLDKETPFAMNASGDIVTIPSTSYLPPNIIYLYCVDGNPSFPTKFDRKHFLPKEPEFLATESSEMPPPILTRSEREQEEAIRLCNSIVSKRGPQKQHRCLWQLPKYMGSQFFGAWLMCIPNQISQPNLSIDDKSKILLRSLGALRTLRSHRRIVADEAGYRALIVACGRCGTDRRVELMKLYGLMRSDGIFPNAVTLGQYTRAIAEGYSNVNVESSTKVGMQVDISPDRQPKLKGFDLEVLDNNLSILEESGLKWRSRGNTNPASTVQPATRVDFATSKVEQDQPPKISSSKTFDTATTQRSIKTKRSWLPVSCSSSFRSEFNVANHRETSTIRLFALWSRATACKSCSYIPLDEETQCGWDVIHNKLETASSVVCPRCAGMIVPLIGYKENTIAELLELEKTEMKHGNTEPKVSDLDTSCVTQNSDLHKMPPQLESSIEDGPGRSGFVTYLSPQKLRMMLEELLLEYGEEVLDRDRLRMTNPEVFFNLWWYSARFSLPLPLAVTSLLHDDPTDGNSDVKEDEHASSPTSTYDCCACASWDKTVALHGCLSAAKAIMSAQALQVKSEPLLREKLFDNPNTDIPLLSFFNLQSYAQGDWDHPDFSEILVALVKACETRDLLAVVECLYQRNKVRQEMTQSTMRQANTCNSLNSSFESAGTIDFSLGASTEASFSPASLELDCYRTILYLARYQCTTAFHAFFPTTIRACKGAHFWCAQGTLPLPIFDRAFREAAESYAKQSKLVVPISVPSAVAVGFRSIFGHII